MVQDRFVRYRYRQFGGFVEEIADFLLFLFQKFQIKSKEALYEETK